MRKVISAEPGCSTGREPLTQHTQLPPRQGSSDNMLTQETGKREAYFGKKRTSQYVCNEPGWTKASPLWHIPSSYGWFCNVFIFLHLWVFFILFYNLPFLLWGASTSGYEVKLWTKPHIRWFTALPKPHIRWFTAQPVIHSGSDLKNWFVLGRSEVLEWWGVNSGE